MKKPVLYVIIILVVIFIIQVFRNSPVTEAENPESPMYGFERDTTTIVIPPRMVTDKGAPVKDPMKAIKEQLYADKYHWFVNLVQSGMFLKSLKRTIREEVISQLTRMHSIESRHVVGI